MLDGASGRCPEGVGVQWLALGDQCEIDEVAVAATDRVGSGWDQDPREFVGDVIGEREHADGDRGETFDRDRRDDRSVVGLGGHGGFGDDVNTERGELSVVEKGDHGEALSWSTADDSDGTDTELEEIVEIRGGRFSQFGFEGCFGFAVVEVYVVGVASFGESGL